MSSTQQCQVKCQPSPCHEIILIKHCHTLARDCMTIYENGIRPPACEQGPDLRYLRQAIWKGKDFLDSSILIQILDVVMNNFGTSWEQPNFGTSWEQPNLELRENNQIWNFVRTTEVWLFSWSWIFGLLALKMTLKVKHDLRFEIYSLHWLYGTIIWD